jgi:hypothetical protein
MTYWRSELQETSVTGLARINDGSVALLTRKAVAVCPLFIRMDLAPKREPS